MEQFLVLVGPLSILVTKLVDVLRNAFDEDDTVPKEWWNLAALGFGLAVALIFQLNALASMLPHDTVIQNWSGVVLTGLAIGGSSSGWHELLDAFSSYASAKRS